MAFPTVIRNTGTGIAGRGVGGSVDVIWAQTSTNYREISTVDLSIVRDVASGFSNLQGMGGNADVIWSDENSTKYTRELSTTDFSIVQWHVKYGNESSCGIGGDTEKVWHINGNTNDPVYQYELSPTDLSVVRTKYWGVMGSIWYRGTGGTENTLWNCSYSPYSSNNILEMNTSTWGVIRQGTGPATYACDVGGDDDCLYFTGYGSNIYEIDTGTTGTYPVVHTLDADDIDLEQATLNANLVSLNGGGNCDERGFDFGTSPGVYTRHVTESGDFGTGLFELDATALDQGTTYYFRAKCHNSLGWGYGGEKSFTTYESSVHTYDPLEIGSDYAEGYGYNKFNAPSGSITQIGFMWGEGESGAYTDDNFAAFDSEYGNFNKQMTGLSPNTTYHYRAAVEHSYFGWVYGERVVFTTLPGVPVVRTLSPACPSDETMTANGEIMDIGGATPDVRGFVYDIESHEEPDYSVAPEDSDYPYFTEENGSFGTGTFNASLEDIVVRRTYYIRAYAHNSEGYAYGDEVEVYYSTTLNILRPNGTGDETNIRFETPRSLPHWYVVRRDDSSFFMPDSWGFGGLSGNFVSEKQYYTPAYKRDLYALENPCKRDEGVIKIKWKAHLVENTYPYSKWKRDLKTGGTVYEGSEQSISGTDEYICEIFYTNPDTSSGWTISELDALQAGVNLYGGSGYGCIALDQLQIDVLWANAAVRTDQANFISSTEMRLNGFVLEDEGDTCQVYFEWGLTDSYGNETTPEDAVYGQYFNAEISGLDPMQTYHYRAVIVTACGETFYGDDVVFDMEYPDRIYAWLGDSEGDEQIELTDPDYPMVLYARTEIGWDEEMAQATAGIAELVCDNFYGDFNPENESGQYYGNLVLGKWLTVYEVYEGTKYRHFTGRIDKILPEDDPSNPTAYIRAVDGMDDIQGTKVSTALRTNTDVGELAEDVLDACGDTASRDIDTGVDTLDAGWFHKADGLQAMRGLELTEKGRFFIKPDGTRRFENRHYRVTGDGLVSQHDFEDTAIRIEYEYSKRLLYNEVIVSGRWYFSGGVQLFVGYDLATIDSGLIWSAHTGDTAAPYVPQNTTLVLWAETQSPIYSYDTLVKGTHWNANSEPDKTGNDLSNNITINETQYGQAVKLEIVNSGGVGAYIVEPDSPPDSETEGRTLLVYGILFAAENVTVIEEDSGSQGTYGKKTLEIDAPFKSKPNEILAYAQWLLQRYYLPIPNPVQVMHIARTNWPDDTLRVQCLIRHISDRITVKSTKLGFDRDFYINKVVQEYAMNEGGMVHETSWVVEQAEGSAEGLYWLLGVAGFGELGQKTVLGF